MAVGVRRLLAAVLLWAAHGERSAIRPHRRGAAAPAANAGPRRGGRRRLLSSAAAVFLAARAKAQEAPGGFATPAELLSELDSDGDGKVSKDEYLARTRASLEKVADETLTASVSAFFNQLFDAADIDGDGALNANELEFSDLLRNVATRVDEKPAEGEPAKDGEEKDEESEPATEEKKRFLYSFMFEAAEENLKRHDSNGNGEIDKEEYFGGMRVFARDYDWIEYFDDPKMQEWMEDTWKKVDVTGDGVLNTAEVHYLSFLVEQLLFTRLFEEVRMSNVLFQEIDADGDGRISHEEVVKKAAAMKEEEEGEDAATQDDGKDAAPTIIEVMLAKFADADADSDSHLDPLETKKIAGDILDEL